MPSVLVMLMIKKARCIRSGNVDQKHWAFYVLDQLHVLPNVNYLAKVRNTDRHIGGEVKKEEKAHA